MSYEAKVEKLVSDETRRIQNVVGEAGVDPISTHRRKLNRLEALLYGISFDRMLKMDLKAAPREEADNEVLTKLFLEKGLTGKQVAKIFAVRDQIGYEWEEAFSRPKKNSSVEKQIEENQISSAEDKEKVVGQVFDLVEAGKSPKEIHALLGVKHPGAMGYIRSARKKLKDKTSSGFSIAVQGEFVNSLENDQFDLSLFDWESSRSSCRILKHEKDMVRIRKKEISISNRGRIFKADRVDVGYLPAEDLLAIKRTEAGFKFRERGSGLEVCASVFIRRHNLSGCYQVIQEAEDLIIAKIMN